VIYDIDGVLANFTRGFVDTMREIDHEAPPCDGPHAAPAWGFEEWYWPEVPRNRVKALSELAWKRIHSVPSFWSGLHPLINSREFMKIRNSERTPVFMTRREPRLAWSHTLGWLQKYGIMEPVLVRVRAGEEKHELAQLLGQDTLVDDKPENCLMAAEAGMQVLMMKYPYNQHVEHPNIRPIDSFSEIFA
jgi:hypothetical protein